MKARYSRRDFHFIKPAVTSRGALTVKETYFIFLERGGITGIGECALFRGLGADDRPDYEAKVAEVCQAINRGDEVPSLLEWSSIRFGLEMAQANLEQAETWQFFPSDWSRSATDQGIKINGLIWMDSPDNMLAAAFDKADAGFDCIKFKIGACDFGAELRMLERFRRRYGPEKIEIRLDANGAWRDDSEALSRLRALAPLDIHSLEQPVKARQPELMQAVVANSPVAIALDEELIGLNPLLDAAPLIKMIRPAYLILKPSLCGGFTGAEQWMLAARDLDVGYWVTSALESNVGLSAISQWTARDGIPFMPQGLGTGALYSDNISSPLSLRGQYLYFNGGTDQ